jgi:Cu2+-exporting ATPase
MQNDGHEQHRHHGDADHAGHPEDETAGTHPNHEPEGHSEQEGHAAREDHEARGNHAAHDGQGEHIDHGVSHAGHEIMFRNRFWVCLALSLPVLAYSEMLQMWFGFTLPAFPGSAWIAPVFSVIVFAYGGIPFLQMAIPEIRDRKPGMMALISLAITVAFGYSLLNEFFRFGEGFFWELVTLIDVMLLGHWLEMRSVRQAGGALTELAKLMPDTAERIMDSGETEAVPAGELKTGDLLLVRPGASVPADGEVAEGKSSVNESMVTGESKPVDKQPGNAVIGGTINGDGSLRVRVTATGDETALAGIMRLVAEAQASRSPAQVLADRAAGWLFYGALIAAILTAVGWILATGFDIEVVKRVVTVLVIACPHALGLAVPLVVAISTSLGARNGVLVRNRLALEAARGLDVIIFDKTGTLTKGEFGLAGMAAESLGEDEALALAAAVEGDSEHLIARAIREAAAERGLSLPSVDSFEAIKGRGIKAKVEGKEVFVGGPRLLEMLEPQMPGPIAAFGDRADGKGQTVIYLIRGGSAVAAFALADVVRPESRAAVERLREMGIEVAMLTGDSRQVAQSIADELGIERVYAEVLPEHKDQKVRELQAEGKKVAMVGDGVNDAPALTRADIGIAIGSGTDVAVESADIILMKSNPLHVVRIVELSRATYSKMVQNLIWATGYNVAAIPLAAGVLAPWGILLSPAVGALLMSLSTVVVAINAQFLRRLRFSGE